MGYLRNLCCFSIFALIIAGCGGGNTTVADNSSTNTGSNTTTSPVAGGSTGSVTLQWTAPTTLADTTPVSLSDISGYKLYYGTSPNDTPNFVNITNGTATQYTINNLPSGTYYFVICAVDSSGHTGLMSAAIQKTI